MDQAESQGRAVARSRRRGVGAVAVAIAAGLLVLAAPLSARADPVPDTGVPGVLTLEADPYPLSFDFTSGERAYWQLTARLDRSTPGELTVAVAHDGALTTAPGGLRLVLRSCGQVWQVPTDGRDEAVCPGGDIRTVIGDTALADLAPDDRWDAGPLPAGGAAYLLAAITLPEQAPAELLVGAEGSLRLTFAAAEDTQGVGGDGSGVGGDGGGAPGPGLAVTGVALGAPLAAAFALVLGGVLLRRSRAVEAAAPAPGAAGASTGGEGRRR
jgi:hypothetical protein